NYVPLRRQGRNYVGLCPWHDDSRPSFQVNAERQSFRCWVCDIGGDVFSFIMRMERLEFREALEMLAERAGVELKPLRGPKPAAGSADDKRTLLAAVAWAEEQYHRCLQQEAIAEAARQYLAERGVSSGSVSRFRLGFAPNDWSWLIQQASGTGFTPAVLDRVGLILKRQQGDGWYDRFRGRVMFPIRDPQSRPIAFGGRVLPELADDRSAKYVNSPETPLFSKSNQLYALDLARKAIDSAGFVAVAEGYTDVIAAHQHGIENVVAVLGTALTEKHLPLLRRFTDSIVLVLDGDEAGRRRANEVLDLFVSHQVDLRILTLPTGLDPCDFISSPAQGSAANGSDDGRAPSGYGPDAFRDLLRQAPDALQHKLSTVTNGLVTNTGTIGDDTHANTQAVEDVLATLAKSRVGLGDATSDLMVREQGIVARIARQFHLPEEGLRQRLVSLRRGSANQRGVQRSDDEPADSPRTRLSDLPKREAELLELMLLDAECARRIFEAVPEAEITADAVRQLLRVCEQRLEADGRISSERLMLVIDDPNLKSLLVELDEACEAKQSSDRQQRLGDLLAAYRRGSDDAQRRRQHAELRDGRLDHHQEEETLGQIFANLKDRQAGRLSTDG
ncbi:MAG: DNA primase, partial [Planctomycetota bacterium]